MKQLSHDTIHPSWRRRRRKRVIQIHVPDTMTKSCCSSSEDGENVCSMRGRNRSSRAEVVEPAHTSAGGLLKQEEGEEERKEEEEEEEEIFSPSSVIMYSSCVSIWSRS